MSKHQHNHKQQPAPAPAAKAEPDLIQASPSPYHFTEAEAQAINGSTARGSLNNPTRVVNAFFPEPLEVCGYRIKPISLYTFMQLEKIDNAFADYNTQQGKRQPKVKDVIEALFVLVTSPDEMDEILDIGKDELKARCKAFALTLPMHKMEEIVQTIGKAFRQSWSTVSAPSSPKDEAPAAQTAEMTAPQAQTS